MTANSDQGIRHSTGKLFPSCCRVSHRKQCEASLSRARCRNCLKMIQTTRRGDGPGHRPLKGCHVPPTCDCMYRFLARALRLLFARILNIELAAASSLRFALVGIKTKLANFSQHLPIDVLDRNFYDDVWIRRKKTAATRLFNQFLVATSGLREGFPMLANSASLLA